MMTMTQPARTSARALAVAGIAIAAAINGAAPVSAQLANPSTRALGMGENFTAAARGYSALSWNPAGLALSGGPGTSATMGTVRAGTGMGPVTLGDLAAVQGEVVPEATRRQWLDAITRDGGQSGAAGFDLVVASVQFGHVGLQFSTVGRAVNNVAPGFAELVLFGNADEDGNPRAFDVGGSSVDMHLYSTGALGFAVPVQLGPGRLAVGATAKYTFGHTLARSGESTGQVTADPITATTSFPLAYAPFTGDDGVNNYQTGGGFSLDLGVGFEAGPWTFAAAVQNVASTFEWDQSQLRYRAMELHATEGEVSSSFSTAPLSTAPAALREAIADYTFRPNYAAGAMFEATPRLTLAADARFGSTDGMSTRPAGHMGAGLEFRLLSWLPVQLGTAMVRLDDEREGLQFSGGVQALLGSFQIGASGARRNVGMGGETIIMVSLLSHTF